MSGLATRWRSYFEARRPPGSDGDGSGTVAATIDLVELYSADPELAQATLDRPTAVLAEARDALREVAASGPVRLRVENNPHLCGVDEVSARHLRDLVTVQGAVESTAPVGAVPVAARYRCPACEEPQTVVPDGIEPAAPARCDDCGWDGDFEFRPGDSEFVDTRPLTLVPIESGEPVGSRADALRAYVYGEMIDAVGEGDRVGVTGILRVRRAAETPPWERYLDGLGMRAEREISPPETLADALDSHWEPG